MAESEFQPVRPFDIDDGQLDGLSPQECFVLGYELAEVDALLDAAETFQKTVHAQNVDRIKAEVERRGLECVIEWPHDDVSESWVFLGVKF